ncbi:MAG: crotonase/enoyl-CoA hydratase family protein [Pseudomonadales bacterium]|nr:crotonase/enoyl-CoA hydratase family protein [Pseudomonadales bacterium]
MNYETIEYLLENGVLTLRLNRPDRMNAFTDKMAHELVDAYGQASADDKVRAIVVTGNGKAFCAGADLALGEDTFNYNDSDIDEDPAQIRDLGGVVTLAMFECTKPIIIAFNGAAVGIGVTMSLAADIRLCTTAAKFGFVFARRGIVPEAGSAWFLPRIVGISQALEWTMSGKVFPAEEAKECGLVKTVYDSTEAMLEAAYGIAQDIADNTSAVSIAMTRQMMWRMLGADHPMEAHKVDSRGIYYTGKSADAKEGVMSFLEKRPAKFTNKVSTDMPDFYPWWKPREFE